MTAKTAQTRKNPPQTDFYTPFEARVSDLGDLARPEAYRTSLDLGDQPTEVMIQKLRDMMLIRLAEEEIAEMAKSGEAKCPTHLAIGQEAASVGVAAHLRPTDRAFGCHRSHSHYLAMGGSVDELLAEIMGKATGCSGGFGGSMHIYAKDVGFYGSVPIVGGTIPLAVGAGIAAQMDGNGDVGIAFFGDGACEEGVLHESLNMAAAFNLPVVFVVENNLFSSHLDIHLRQPSDRVARFADAAKMRSVTVDGNDVVAVMREAGKLIEGSRNGQGPCLIEAITYRWLGHVGPNADIDVGVRRSTEELNAWKGRDPVERLLSALETRGYTRAQFQSMCGEIKDMLAKSRKAANAAPWPVKEKLTDIVYAAPKKTAPKAAPAGHPQTLNYGQALRAAQEYLLANHPETFVIGQGVWSPWYVGNSMTDLDKQFGRGRVIDTPVSEAATTGAATGAALCGYKPLVIHPRIDFMILACDAIVNQAAKWAHMLGGKARPSVTVRGIINRGGEQGAQHSQALHSWFAHIPGLRVVMPSTVADARDLLIASVLSDDPVMFIDDRWLYAQEDTLPPPQDIDLATIKPAVRREGRDVTIVAASFSVMLAMEAAKILAERGIETEVIDLRVINPIDHDAAIASVRKTGRLCAIDGGWTNCGLAGEIIAGVSEQVEPGVFKAMPQRITIVDAPAPTSKPLEDIYYPSVQDIVSRIEKLCARA